MLHNKKKLDIAPNKIYWNLYHTSDLFIAFINVLYICSFLLTIETTIKPIQQADLLMLHKSDIDIQLQLYIHASY